MSGKKLAVSIALLLLFAGGAFIAWPFRGSGGKARPPSEPMPSAVKETAEGSHVAPLPQTETRPAEIPKAVRKAPSRGSLLVRVRWEEDGSPAEGVHIWIVPWPSEAEIGPSKCSLDGVDAVTGPEGTARADGLLPGRVTAFADRADGVEAGIRAGEVSKVDLQIPQGVTVNGTVVDETGEPVGGAAILIVSGCGIRAARSDPEGRYVLRSIRPGLKVGARAEGYAPSFLREIKGSPGETMEIELVLQGPGGALRGIVKDWEKGPLTGAEVLVKDARILEQNDLDRPVLPVSERVRTDAEGRFSIEGLAAGDVEVLITATGHAPFHELVEVEAEGTTEKEFVLGTGATIEGTVRWPDGKPAPGASVFSGFENDRRVQTAEDGSYSAKDLPHGEVTLRVACRGARAEKTFDLGTGKTVRWDPVLAESKDISGRVLDDEGVPLQGWSVHVRDDDFSHGARYDAKDPTDADGRFRIAGCRDLTYFVGARAPGCKYPSAAVKGIRPGGEDIEIRVPRAALPSVYISGLVLDPDRKPAGGAMIAPKHREAGEGYYEHAGEDGRFRIGPLPPAKYDVSIEFGELPAKRFPTRAFGAGEILDLGIVQLSRGGFLRARILGEGGGSPPTRPGLVIEAEDRSFGKPLEIARDWTASFGPLGPGAYVVKITGHDIACAERPVEILEDATTEVDITVRPGVRRILRLAAAGSVKLGVVRLVVRDANGNGVLRTSTSDPKGEGRFAIEWICLGLGSYTVEASTETGLRGQGKLEVLDLSESEDPVEIELK